jgi:hypothetical protein
MSSKKKWGSRKAGEFLRAQALYDLPTKCRNVVLLYIPEESHPVLLGAKGPLHHSAEMRERENPGSQRGSDSPTWQ